jgi:hypothetical protein
MNLFEQRDHMQELSLEQVGLVSGGGINRTTLRTAARFISAGARFGGPVGFAVGIGIAVAAAVLLDER